MTISLDEFKAGMRRLAAGVTLITTRGADGARSGLTATAVCSLSAEPPTLLVCVNRRNGSHAAIRAAGVFAVNVLAVDDRQLADRFASPIPPESKFDDGLWHTAATGAPLLESALVAFDCTLSRAVDAGTHEILVGAIQAVRTRKTEVKPLLFAHGGYGGFASQQSAGMADLLWMPSWRTEADGW
jgi:flavin reductase (DIM6/NTAB) family NADH-FMN oxidoreductase RutF